MTICLRYACRDCGARLGSLNVSLPFYPSLGAVRRCMKISERVCAVHTCAYVFRVPTLYVCRRYPNSSSGYPLHFCSFFFPSLCTDLSC